MAWDEVATPDAQLLYENAVNDAALAEPSEISYALTAIVKHNEKLSWDPQGRVLMLTWTGWDGYDDQVGQETELTQDVWVTAVPYLKEFCRGIVPKEMTAIDDRLEQLLGLPPRIGKDRFVEMWVPLEDLFRPSPDPEVSDQEAELDFPISSLVRISPTYRAWFDHQKSISYGEDGYPWTRLGYTYDWGNPHSEVGLSEFVIRSGSDVAISAVYATDEYCQ